MNEYKKLFEEDVKMNELKQRYEEKTSKKEENEEYMKLKHFITSFPIEMYLNK